ncbi:hypothetical protein B9T11_07070 [Wohlfahrtiimonas chitiniclastica]|uniref:hypothetical protein n=1 Tax=Wohlfahrtiimonas chitiniclastica TaxID=400946 RepID=UPI000B97E557|nr:hypothetical protein [Wohlfahrtiimonas chitiniclastica]OYQ70002.1 hypothetical protein B9T13_07030 [Wohlfahrtiimonas chitiniclastica]OYQ79703.1 hypothetical protein B9T11_07070 [Wohlfahrtiimonas chitiniclastica]OYQ83247.1 hypothetical protein B9T14_08335 [Wohlfahrtiimonas chitiniclastica]OYQ84219.1 hypothetical protein B9T15_08365 [Wohlfahrtiimonas chitiniclastica]
MIKQWLCIALCSVSIAAADINIPPAALNEIAGKIYRNETGGKRENLVVWNNGENFPSLGIGHFIWYKYNEPERFEESFPALVTFYKTKNIELPWLLRMYRYAPWKTQAEFLSAKHNDPAFKDLENFLYNTQAVQIEFIAERLNASLPKILAATSQKKRVKENFNRLLNTPSGLYALIDYINFKGEGINQNERYQGQGWGLLQVLEAMDPNVAKKDLMQSFRTAAKTVMSNRVKNAPKERNEERWLAGWHNRIDTYQ